MKEEIRDLVSITGLSLTSFGLTFSELFIQFSWQFWIMLAATGVFIINMFIEAISVMGKSFLKKK